MDDAGLLCVPVPRQLVQIKQWRAFPAILPLIDCRILADIPQAPALASRLIDTKAVPATEPEDAAHFAIATLTEVKYIVSWNFSHLVGPQAKRQLESAISKLGYVTPILATPEEIFEAESS